MALKPYSVGRDNNGAISYALKANSKSNDVLVTSTDEQVLAIPTTSTEVITAVLVTPQTGVDMWFTDNTSASSGSIVSSGVGTQSFLTGPRLFELTTGSTYIHYKVKNNYSLRP